MEPAIVVHGGAWSIPDRIATATKEGVRAAASKAYKVLVDGGTAVDAAQLAVMTLEDNSAFDAGIT
jgi:beta-aspartyl-peptidase (threonine type)